MLNFGAWFDYFAGPSFFTAAFRALLPRLVRLLHANATPATLAVRHRVVRLFRFCLDNYRDSLLPVRASARVACSDARRCYRWIGTASYIFLIGLS